MDSTIGNSIPRVTNMITATIIMASFIDILKQILPLYLNFGNQALNYAIMGFIITMINFIVHSFNKTALMQIFYRSKDIMIINSTNEDFLVNKLNNSICMNTTWKKESLNWYRLKYFLVTNLQNKIKKFTICTEENGDSYVNPSDGDLFSFVDFIPKDTTYPLYYNKGHIVGIGKNDNCVFIVYDSNEIYNEFLDILSKVKPPPAIKEVVHDDTNEILFHKQIISCTRYSLFRDRNLDNIISVYKPMIKEYLKSFQNACENGISQFNGFGSYNLGIMLHGKPGCGKTSMIKAIANELNRSVIIVNMREIKTCNDFKKLFYVSGDNNYYKKYIYVLEEIDCIDSVISRDIRDSKTDILSSDDERKYVNDLNDRHLQLLKILNKENEANVKPEIDKVLGDIKNFNERLSLDTLLTELDGIIEMRGRVIIATTNFIDRIDSALLREGRFDIKIELRKFNEAEIKEMLIKMYAPNHATLINSSTFPNDIWTPAKIRNICHMFEQNEIHKVIDVLSKAHHTTTMPTITSVDQTET